MLFSYTEFQNIKSKIIEDFNSVPVQYFSLAEDQRQSAKDRFLALFNEIKANNRKKKQKISILNRKRSVLQERSCFSEAKSKFSDRVTQTRMESNFYLTENTYNFTEELTLNEKDEKSEQSEIEVLKQKGRQVKMKQKYLMSEINQIQNSIRFYRKEITFIENKLKVVGNSQFKMQNKIKGEKVNAYKVQKNSSQIMYGLKTTLSHFDKSVKNLKYSMDQERRKAENLIDELCENLLAFKKKQEKIQEQGKEIQQLSKENEELQDEKKMYNDLVLKSEMLLKAFNVMSGLNSPQQNCNDEEKVEDISGSKILKICEKLSNFLLRMKENEEKLRKKCQLKIQEKEQLEKIKKLLDQKIVAHYSESLLKGFIHEQSDSEGEEVAMLKKKDKIVKKITTIAISFEDRILYFVKKQILRLKYMISNWVKFDNSACEFLFEMENQIEKIAEMENEPIQESEIKTCMMEFFEKWESYIFFQEYIGKNVFINRYLTKAILVKYLKKIIKTKINKINLPTKQLFITAIKDINEKSIKFWFQKTYKLLRLSKDIYQYTTKFQILIINAKEVRPEIKYIEDSKSVKKRETKTNINDRESEQVMFQTKNTGMKETDATKSQFQLHDMILTYQEELKTLTKWNKFNKKI